MQYKRLHLCQDQPRTDAYTLKYPHGGSQALSLCQSPHSALPSGAGFSKVGHTAAHPTKKLRQGSDHHLSRRCRTSVPLTSQRTESPAPFQGNLGKLINQHMEKTNRPLRGKRRGREEKEEGKGRRKEGGRGKKGGGEKEREEGKGKEERKRGKRRREKEERGKRRSSRKGLL